MAMGTSHMCRLAVWGPCSQPPGSTVGLQRVPSAPSAAVSPPSPCHGDPPAPGAADGHRVVTLEHG